MFSKPNAKRCGEMVKSGRDGKYQSATHNNNDDDNDDNNSNNHNSTWTRTKKKGSLTSSTFSYSSAIAAKRFWSTVSEVHLAFNQPLSWQRPSTYPYQFDFGSSHSVQSSRAQRLMSTSLFESQMYNSVFSPMVKQAGVPPIACPLDEHGCSPYAMTWAFKKCKEVAVDAATTKNNARIRFALVFALVIVLNHMIFTGHCFWSSKACEFSCVLAQVSTLWFYFF